MKTPWYRAVTWAAPLLATVLTLLGARGRGDPPRPEPAAPAPPGPTRLYFGIAACVQCHTRPGEREPVLCRCTEATIWEAEDKHRDAFQVLRGPRAKEIGKLLRFQNPVWQDRRCVSCHGVWIEDAKLRHRTFKEEDGVSCVACHGAHREWVALHGDVLERDTWRGYSRKLKEEKYGMRDLWDPARRARLCASCHVGNLAEGKVVTHAMYAAGHPPLPGVELATFSDAMPRHWQYLREKKAEVRELLHVNAAEAAFEQTKLVAVGGVVVLRESLDLLAGEAALAVPEQDPKVIWPELARFDCAACHHELAKPTWRPKPESAGEPGLPRAPRWPGELAGLVLDQLGGETPKEFRHHLDDLQKSLKARPFGEPKEIARTVRQAVDWLDRCIPQASARKFDRAAALQLLRRLASLSTERMPEYDSARQRVWALRVIYGELAGASEPKPANDQPMRQILERLNKELKLQLPAGRKRSIEEQLPDGLRTRSDYDPAGLQQALREFVKLLPEK